MSFQYADFGSDIQYLARNLEKLSKVIQDVTKQIPQTLSPEEHAWDLKSLLKICGDFRKTIYECEKLLDDHTKFGRGPGGFVLNIQWNLTIEPEVRRLKDRVAFHNIKIATILKPLETKLMLDLKDDIYKVRGDVASRVTDVHESVLEVLRKIEGHWTSNAQEASAQASSSPPEAPRVPDYLEIRFEMAAKASNSELLDEKNFPFYKGVNAFHHHFEQSTALFKFEETSTGDIFAERTPEPAQYLNLEKGIWIIQKIKKGSEWAEASADRLSDCYMKELEDKCCHEYSRFTIKEEPRRRLTELDKRNISLLRVEEFRIWLDDDEGEDEFRSATDYLNEILRVSLLSSSRHRKQELVLIRRSDIKLQMQNFSSKITGPPNREIIRDHINLERAYFVPLYASPDSSPEAFNIVFRGDESAGEDTALRFLKLKDMLDFQQAITAYKVVFDEPDIRTLLFQATGFFSGKKTAEVGRIQIWNPRRLERCIPQAQIHAAEFSQHRWSVTTGSSTALSVSKTFSTAHTSPVATKDTISYSFELPGLPILVFYLKAEDSDNDELSFLTIQMDSMTIVRGTCGCDRKRRMTGHPANLARLGKYPIPRYPEFERKLKWLHIEFASQANREKFEHEFEQTKDIYKQKILCYHREMSQAKQNHLG
ncbi:MAG: hypothetical protein Q9217_000536 [Psora testacea]